MPLNSLYLAIGSASAFIAVAAGAFGAHGLKTRVTPDLLDVWKTAAQYQMYHALGLIALAALAPHLPGRLPGISAWLFIIGTLIFSGTLYALTWTGISKLGAITPIGGACFLAGWICLFIAALRCRQP